MFSFKCSDIGMSDSFQAKAQNKNELMTQIAAHAKKEHKMESIPPDVMKKIQKAIKEN